VNAWGDYQTMPDVFLHIQALTGLGEQLRPVPPTSYKGQIDVATVMSQLAANMGYTFENNGVSVQLSDVYLANTGLEQVKELARSAGIWWGLDDNKVLWITPAYGARGGLIPLISKDTGLIGYPTFDALGVNFRTLFNPGIVFGRPVNLQSDLKQATGQWNVMSLAHHLESEKPGGSWFSTVRGIKGKYAITS